jgi:hypothetical protein
MQPSGLPTRSARRRAKAPFAPIVRACAWKIVFVFVAWTSAAPAGGQDRSLEYKIKAAYLYNFTKYAEWPASGLADPVPGAPFVIGVVGASPIVDHLRAIAAVKTVGDRPLKIRQFNDASRLQYCPIVFVSEQTPPEEQQKVLEALADLPVLTVGEDKRLLEHGGVTCFTIKDDRVNLAISKSGYERAGLKFSSKLLQLDVVEIVK